MKNIKYNINFDIDLRRNTGSGLYIALEGIDGAGKTVQAEKLTNYFRGKGKEVVQTREPRKEGMIGDLVHQVLTNKIKIPDKALQYLFSTDRVIHHEEVILPALAEGKIVISDRCFWSAVVYGILDRSKEYDYESANQILVAQSILSMYHQFTVPDYTFYLHISLDEALKRIEQKHQGAAKEIYEVKEKVDEVRKGYDWLLGKFGRELTQVDGEKHIDEVTSEILKIVEKSGRI